MAVENDVTLDVTFDKDRYSTGESIHVEALLYSGGERQSDEHMTGGELIEDATVILQGTDPYGNPLGDELDPSNPLSEIGVYFTNAGEGLYTCTLDAENHITTAGSYNFTVVAFKVTQLATASTPGVVEFERRSTHSVFIASAVQYGPESESLFDIQLAIMQLPDNVFEPPADNRKNAFMEKLDEVGMLINEGQYSEAADKLENDILTKMDGFSGGIPANDWIIEEEAQLEIYAKVQNLIAMLRDLVKPAQPKNDDLNQEDELLPDSFGVSQAYPNPFNPWTEIRYQLPQERHVSMIIYNILGRPVKRLVDEVQKAGHYTARWDGRDERGNLVSSGIYLCRFQAGDYIATRKLMFME
jgi:hypothetical protein